MISCFLYALYTHLYVAGAVIALFVEVNSVTLHLRLMLKLAGAQTSTMYYINKFANLFTYVTFRLSTQFYLTWYIVQNYSWLDNGGFFLTSMIMMNIMIMIYFYRLLRADFFSWSKSYMKQNGTYNNNSKKFLTDWVKKVYRTVFLFFIQGGSYTCCLSPDDSSWCQVFVSHCQRTKPQNNLWWNKILDLFRNLHLQRCWRIIGFSTGKICETLL